MPHAIRPTIQTFSKAPRAARRRGLTLLELLLSIGLMTLLMSFMFTFYGQTLEVRERGTKAIQSTQLARVIATQIAEEIRAAGGSFSSLGPGILGTEREIRLNTTVLPDRALFRRQNITDTPPPAQCDMRQIRWYIAYDIDDEIDYDTGETGGRNLGIVRREVRTLHQPAIKTHLLEQVDTDPIGPELGYMRFRYFDGVEWVKTWDMQASIPGMNTLPQAVEVTIGYKPMPPIDPDEIDLTSDDADDIAMPEPFSPENYTIVVRIPQADTFFGSRLLRAQKKMQSSGVDASGGGRL